MSSKHLIPVAICPSSQVVELGKYPFNVRYRGENRDALLIRFKGTVYGYLNQCVHMPRALDCEHQNIFDDSERYLQCSMHSICYDPVSGESVSEICAGKKLTAIKIREDEGWVYLIDKRADLAEA
jgi:nitrite reductase/ring-hydroxylating ferredoxin subunit